MATVTLTNASNIDVWLPDLLGFGRDDLADNGGTVTVSGGASRVIVVNPASPAGSLQIDVTGTGFTYGPSGGPVGGTVTGFSVSIDGEVWMTIAGLEVELSDLDHWMFGWESRGQHRPGDGFDLMTLLLSGNDVIFGSDNDDDMIGGRNGGNDVINGGAGFDWIKADAGNDTIDGGADRDTYTLEESFYDAGAYRGAVVDLGTGVATDSWGGTDSLTSIERVFGSRMSDRFTGAAGNEQFAGLRGNDTINGGAGSDTVRYDRDAQYGGVLGVKVNLATGTAIDGWGNTDRLSNIENVRGSGGGDAITGNGQGNRINGGAGVDTINGGQGADTAEFWNDGVSEGAEVNLSLATGQVLNDGFGNVETLTSIEHVLGTHLGDALTGNAGANELIGDGGNDTLRGGGGADTLVGGGGNDRLTGGAGVDTFVFDRGDDDDPWGDTISDFRSGTDNIAFFTPDFVGMDDTLQFRNGTSAGGTGSWFYFDASNRGLFWDADGTGAGAAVRVATLTGVTALTAADFELWV